MIAIPTMSSIGWVSSIEEKADYVLSTFITSNYSQSVIFAGNITSLQYLVKQYTGDYIGLESQLRTIIDEKMRRAFSGSDVTSTVDVSEDETKPRELTINIRCIIAYNGRDYTLGKVVQFRDSKIVAISNSQ